MQRADAGPAGDRPSPIRLGSAPHADTVVVMHHAGLVVMVVAVVVPRTGLGHGRRDGEEGGGDQGALDEFLHVRVS